MQRIGLSLLLITLLWPAPALSQAQCPIPAGQSCACTIPLDALQNGVFGRLSPTAGDVLVTKAFETSAVTSPQTLSVGDAAVVLADGSAVLDAGPSCSLALPAQSSLVIRAFDGCACASLVTTEQLAAAEGRDLHIPEHLEDDGAGNGNGGVGGAIAAALVIGGVTTTILLLEGDGGSVSP